MTLNIGKMVRDFPKSCYSDGKMKMNEIRSENNSSITVYGMVTFINFIQFIYEVDR